MTLEENSTYEPFLSLNIVNQNHARINETIINSCPSIGHASKDHGEIATKLEKVKVKTNNLQKKPSDMRVSRARSVNSVESLFTNTIIVSRFVPFSLDFKFFVKEKQMRVEIKAHN